MQQQISKAQRIGGSQGNAEPSRSVRQRHIAGPLGKTPTAELHRLGQPLVDVLLHFHAYQMAQHDGRDVRAGRIAEEELRIDAGAHGRRRLAPVVPCR